MGESLKQKVCSTRCLSSLSCAQEGCEASVTLPFGGLSMARGDGGQGPAGPEL